MSDAKIITVANNQLGSGKTTIAANVISYFLNNGQEICSVDAGSKPGRLTHFVENRKRIKNHKQLDLKVPTHYSICPDANLADSTIAEFYTNSLQEIVKNSVGKKYVVIDAPTNNQAVLSKLYQVSDIVVTPYASSGYNPDIFPQKYFHLMNEQIRMAKSPAGSKSLRWIIALNRYPVLDEKTKKTIAKTYSKAALEKDFEFTFGFSERALFNQLFMQGVTLADISDKRLNIKTSISHIAAKQELFDLISNLDLDNNKTKTEQRLNKTQKTHSNA